MSDKYNSHIPKPNMRFGKLTTISRRKGYSKTYWICKCDCGNEMRKVARLDLLNDIITQCHTCNKKTMIENVLNNSVLIPLNELSNQ